MINIVIPSYSRAHDLKGKDYFIMGKYVVPESQVEEYTAMVGISRVIGIPDDQDGDIAKKRNWILKNIPRPLIMIDDDVKCLRYWENREDEYLSEEFPRILLPQLFNQLVEVAEEFGVKMFGLAQNKDDRSYKEFLPFNLSNIILGPFQGHLEHNLQFDPKVGSKDDYDMSLQQLNRYHKVLRFNKYAYDCEHGDNSGGIVSYRTQEKEIEWCKAIMIKWGKDIITYRIPPRNTTDLLNAKKVTVPIKGV